VVKFLFSVHTITEAKQSNRQGGARAVDLPAGSFDGIGGARPEHVPGLKGLCGGGGGNYQK